MTADTEVLAGLRIETAERLGYDLEHILPWQEAHLGTVCQLLFIQDQHTAALARGETVDPRDIAIIGTQLQDALKPSFTTDNANRQRENETVTAELDKIVSNRITARKTEEQPFFARLTVALDASKPADAVNVLLDLLDHCRVCDVSLDRCRALAVDLVVPRTVSTDTDRSDATPPPPAKVVYLDNDVATDIDDAAIDALLRKLPPRPPETDAERIDRINRTPLPAALQPSPPVNEPWRPFVGNGRGISTAPRPPSSWSPRRGW